MRRSYLRGAGARGRAIYRPATVSRLGSAGDSTWRAWGCRETLGLKPRSQDVVLDYLNHLQQREGERRRAFMAAQAWPVLERAGTRRASSCAREEGP